MDPFLKTHQKKKRIALNRFFSFTVFSGHSCWSIYLQAASAAAAPSPAAVVSCRTLLLRQSPAAKTPAVRVVQSSPLAKYPH
jgi:hypothetical protein